MIDFTTPSWSWLDRYLAGKLTDAERATLNAWCTEHGVDPTQLHTLHRAVHLAGAPVTESDMTAFVARMQKARVAREVPERFVPRHVPSKPSWARQHWVASATVVLGIAALVLLTGRLSITTKDIVPRTYATGSGQQRMVTLANGIHITLGPATVMTVVDSGRGHGHIATLTGQALFTVPHADRTPFTVRTSNAMARVLGTTFMVRRYATDRATRVVVADGRIAVGNTVLSAHSRALVDDSGAVVVTRNIAVDDDTSWTTGRLIFVKTPVRDIVAELRRIYDVRIQLADSALADHALTWTVPLTSQSLDDVLETLGILIDAHVRYTGGIITIVPGRAPVHQPAAPRGSSPHSLTVGSQYGK